MLLIVFSSLIPVAKGTMHKANKWQDNWHAQVLLLHINKADGKYELSNEMAVLQFNSLNISSKLILHCRMEKQAWEMHWKCQEGREPRNPPPTLPFHTSVRKLCQQSDWGGIGSDRAPCWMHFSIPCMPEVLYWGILLWLQVQLVKAFETERHSYQSDSSKRFNYPCPAGFF